VAWEESSKFRNPLIVSWLQASEESVIDVCWVCGPDAIAAGDNARVDTSGVAMPDLDHCVCDWIAGVHVDDLGVEDEFDTFLVLSDVFADIFSRDPVWALGHFRGEDARAVAREDDGFGGCVIVALGGLMVGSQGGCCIASNKIWCLCMTVSKTIS
jgi:hypothetical protein